MLPGEGNFLLEDTAGNKMSFCIIRAQVLYSSERLIRPANVETPSECGVIPRERAIKRVS